MWTRLPCDTSGLLISHALSPSWGRHADRPCIVATTAGWMSVPTADRRWPAKGRATWRTCAGGGELGSSPRRPPARRLGTSREIALSFAAGIAGRRLFQAEREADRLTPRRGKPELDDRSPSRASKRDRAVDRHPDYARLRPRRLLADVPNESVRAAIG